MKIYPHLNPKERRIIIFLCFVEDTERQAAKTPDTLDFSLDHSFFRAFAPSAWQKHQGPWKWVSGEWFSSDLPRPRYPVNKQAVSDKERGNARFLWPETFFPKQSKARYAG